MPVSSKGQSLRCSPGWGNPRCCTVTVYVGKGSKREQWCLFHSLLDFSHFPCSLQANWAFLVLLPSVWVCCVHSRTPWVSPRNSLVRLGVSPAATSTPTGVFNQRFEALFFCAGALGCVVCCWVHQLLPCLPCSTIHCLTGSASCCLAASSLPHLLRTAHLHPS